MRIGTILRLYFAVAAPLFGVAGALLAYGPSRAHATVAEGTSQVATASGSYHPYPADLMGLMSTLVLAGLGVTFVVGTLAIGHIAKGRHVKVR